MNINEKIENESVAIFLKEVAKISRFAYIEGQKLFKIMKENFINYKGNKISNETEDYKKEFSCWFKKIEIEKGIKEYENILNLKELFVKNENKKEQKFLNKFCPLIYANLDIVATPFKNIATFSFSTFSLTFI